MHIKVGIHFFSIAQTEINDRKVAFHFQLDTSGKVYSKNFLKNLSLQNKQLLDLKQLWHLHKTTTGNFKFIGFILYFFL
jgi:hypothetical protein